jgi:hypothetical protein
MSDAPEGIRDRISHRRDKQNAKQLKTELQSRFGERKFADLEEMLISKWNGDERESEHAARNELTARSGDLQILADILTLIQFAILMYRILKYLGLLNPSPQQVADIIENE